MATNATKDEVEETQVENTEPELSVEDDLDQARKELEEKESTSEEDTKSDESPEVEEEAKAESDTTLTTPQEPEHDLAWYQKAYPESTKEALRLKKENDELKAQTPPPPVLDSQEKTGTLTPTEIYVKQQQDKEIAQAFAPIVEAYPQVKEPEEYKRFEAMARTFGKTIYDAEERYAPPEELYAKTVIALGWTNDSEQLGSVLKDSASSSRVSSGPAKPNVVSKVTDSMIKANRRWYPNKSDTEIREELEPHVQ